MKIIEKDILTDNGHTRVIRVKIEAPLIASKAKAGQFVVLMVKPEGERVPLTVVDADKSRGAITLIFQEAGFTTTLLGTLEKGQSLYSIVGPLGHATEIKNYGRVILVGGGVGIAEIYPVAKAMSAYGEKEAGNNVTTIIGARSKGLLILEKELKVVSDELYVATDDGSYGRKGFVTDVLKEKITSPATFGGEARNDRVMVYAVGPIPMMKAVSAVTKACGVKTLVSLNALMVDGTGMCGCCRVTVDGETRFSCIDGPEFDGHLVDWEELGKRNNIYVDKEKHICRLHKI